MRIFAMLETALFEAGSVLFEIPDGHRLRGSCRDSDDDVREIRPRVIEVVLRRSGRMIRMRVIEPEKLAAKLRRTLFREAVVGPPHEKSSSPTFFGRIQQRDDLRDANPRA